MKKSITIKINNCIQTVKNKNFKTTYSYYNRDESFSEDKDLIY